MVSIQILESEDLEKLENFVKQTTNEKYKQQANQEIERIVFQIALEENTAKKYEDYIKRFPNGVYIKLAKEKLNDVLYNEVIVSSTLTSMISFIKNNTEHPRRQQILERLKEKSLKQLSIEGIKTVLEIENDTLLINKFIKDYLTDPTKENIALIEEAFPEQKSSKALQTAKTLNEDYNFLIRKTSINNNDLKNHRGLFFKKNNSLTFILLEKYFAQQKNNKNKDLRFESEITYNLSQSDNLSISLIDKEFEETDIVPSANKVFSAHTKDGYQPESFSRNEDIYIIKTNEVGNQDTILLPCSVNTRFNETSPMLSKDGKTLFFSSDAGLNHGGLDIYISHREDTTLTDNWSNPILLGSNINTNQNDYVVSLSEYKIVLANDNSTNQRTFLINDDLEFENAYVLDQKGKFLSEEVIVIDSTTLDTIYIVKSNENGYVSFLKPNKPYYLYAQKYGHISFFSEDNSQIVLQNIEELFSTKQFYLLDSPFNEKKLTEITPKGKRELEYLAKSLKDSKFVTTISVHVHSVNKTEKAQEISEKQVQIITDILIKNGVNKDNLIIASYANTSPLIGWEGKDRIEIGFLIEK
jgi:outer membrane protein OmpA-like peptidoglycan-associated protein